MTFPAAELRAAVGAGALEWTRVIGGGFGTNTLRWRVTLDDGRSVFVKKALDELAAGWLRAEHRVYSAVEAGFLPGLVGWHDNRVTILALEDLRDAHWPPPWTEAQIEAVRATLDDVHATAPAAGLPTLESMRERLDGWELVAADPRPLLATGLCSSAWLEAELPRLRRASACCRLGGRAFLHCDVRSDNLCLRNERVLLVDWNLACVGNPLLDLVFWLPSLKLEGGPEPWDVVSDSGGLAALIAGFFASRAGLPAPETAPTVRDFQLRQARIALPWAARELGLAPLTLPT